MHQRMSDMTPQVTPSAWACKRATVGMSRKIGSRTADAAFSRRCGAWTNGRQTLKVVRLGIPTAVRIRFDLFGLDAGLDRKAARGD
jgi:hypothetical protein